MIATTIAGGIGNQMFMYAAAKALALRNHTQLAVNADTGFLLDKEYQRNYELDCFNLSFRQNRLATFHFPCSRYVKALSRTFGRNILAPHYIYYRDSTDNRGVDSAFFDIKSANVFLDGYWQSEAYFKDFEKEIRNDFSFTSATTNRIVSEVHRIFCNTSKVPVCVGVRRYQECKHKMSFSITDEAYYLKAMAYIQASVGNPRFYVFSQDKEWVYQELIAKSKFDIVLVPEHSASEDLYLMSNFRFHIISNSSFYWWGAWLADGDIVVSNDNFINKKSNCDKWIIL